MLYIVISVVATMAPCNFPNEYISIFAFNPREGRGGKRKSRQEGTVNATLHYMIGENTDHLTIILHINCRLKSPANLLFVAKILES